MLLEAPGATTPTAHGCGSMAGMLPRKRGYVNETIVYDTKPVNASALSGANAWGHGWNILGPGSEAEPDEAGESGETENGRGHRVPIDRIRRDDLYWRVDREYGDLTVHVDRPLPGVVAGCGELDILL